MIEVIFRAAGLVGSLAAIAVGLTGAAVAIRNDRREDRDAS